MIVLVFILRYQITTAQTGYKETDTVKYTRNVVITNSINFKTVAYYQANSIRKIIREFIGNGFSSSTIYYIQNDLLLESVYVSLRQGNEYFEEHTYFLSNKMTKWENSTDKIVDSTLVVYSDKEKLVLKFFEDDLKEAKSKKRTK